MEALFKPLELSEKDEEIVKKRGAFVCTTKEEDELDELWDDSLTIVLGTEKTSDNNLQKLLEKMKEYEHNVEPEVVSKLKKMKDFVNKRKMCSNIKNP